MSKKDQYTLDTIVAKAAINKLQTEHSRREIRHHQHDNRFKELLASLKTLDHNG